MRPIIEIYIAYLELAIIGMILGGLFFISVAGLAYGGRGLMPALLALVTLILIACIAYGRRREVRAHPEIKNSLFGEIRLFGFLLRRKVLKITNLFNFGLGKPVTQHLMVRGVALIILVLTGYIMWESFSISADITAKKKEKEQEKQIQAVKNNQFIAGAEIGFPATFFNKTLIIEVTQISADDNGSRPKVWAVIRSVGYPELKIEAQEAGYETRYVGRDEYTIQIVEVIDSKAMFSVQRRINP